jgi:Holliday junction resolvase RusA-like endonuclease
MLKLRLKLSPPSANRAWRLRQGKGGKRAHMSRSDEFRDWEKLAIEEFKKHAADRLPDLCYWRTEIFIPRRQSRFDLDNTAKPIHDAIVRANIAPDDRYLVKFSAQFWAGDHLLIYVHEERLTLWQKIMKPSVAIIRRMERALTSTLNV